jgi:hypothetical protein
VSKAEKRGTKRGNSLAKESGIVAEQLVKRLRLRLCVELHLSFLDYLRIDVGKCIPMSVNIDGGSAKPRGYTCHLRQRGIRLEAYRLSKTPE